jgi:hypothetical protein
VAQQLGKRRGVDQAPHDGVIGVDRPDNGFVVLCRRQCCRGLLGFQEIARRAERFEQRGGEPELMFGLRSRTRHGSPAAEREMAQRTLIAFANQFEDARTLATVVVRLGKPPAAPCVAPAEPENSPHAPGMMRASMRDAMSARRASASGARRRRRALHTR